MAQGQCGHPFAPGGRSRGTVLAMPHFCAGRSCPCAAAVVRTFCKKHRGRGGSSLSCGRYANRRSYEAIPQTKIGQGEKAARQGRLATNRPEGLGLQGFNSAAARSVRSFGRWGERWRVRQTVPKSTGGGN